MTYKIYTEDQIRLVDETDKIFRESKWIIAAGGVVINDEGEILIIFRRGKWDLPKGKLEKDEPLEVCAEREIKEETGLSELIFQKPVITTYHTYVENGNQILKETHWFLFKVPGKQEVKPQAEEDITRIEWVPPSQLPNYTKNTYRLIKGVLQAAGY